MVENRTFVTVTASIFLSFVCYAVYVHFSNDPRLNAGSIGPSEMHWWEFVHWLITGLSAVPLAIASIAHAYQRKNYGWLFSIAVFWPIFFAYAWRESGRSDGH